MDSTSQNRLGRFGRYFSRVSHSPVRSPETLNMGKSNSLEMLLGLQLGSRTLEQLNQTLVGYATSL